ncbi:MAG: DUF4968 domain-containing protein, partial [Bacteroidota bacterium]|nr:DUF4968 domain-containing protein [Bacteroidota bacterium]
MKLRQKSILIAFLSGLFIVHISAQSYVKTAHGVKAKIRNMDVEVQFYSSQIVRILKSPLESKFKKESLSVIKTPEKVAFSINQNGDLLLIRSANV